MPMEITFIEKYKELRVTLDRTAAILVGGGTGGKITKNVPHTALSNLTQGIGSIVAGGTVLKIVVDVTEAFECDMTIGTSSAHGILTTLNDVNIAKVGTYTIENFVNFVSSTVLNAYFSATSSTGDLDIIIFYL